MADPWAAFRVNQAPTQAGDPWAAFRAPSSEPSHMPSVGDAWADPETGEQRLIVEPSLERKPGQFTLADVKSRMASLAQGSPQLPKTGSLGATSVGPADLPAQAAAANTDEFTQKVLLANPEEQAAAMRVLGGQRASDRSPLETGAREAVNTFGVGLPRLASAALSSTSTAKEHEIQKAADAAGRRESPRAAQAGQMAGVLGQVAATPAFAVATPARAAIAGALLAGGETAVDTRGDIKETAKSAVKGAFLGAGGNVMLGAPQASSRAFIAENAPSQEALRQFSTDSYKAARASGARYAEQPVSDAVQKVADALQSEGFRPLNQPKSFNVLKEMDRLKGTTPGVDDLESVRKAAQRIAADPAESASAGYIRRGIDDLMDNTKAADVVAGDPEAAALAIRDARGNYAAAKRSETLTDAMTRADLAAAASGSGANVDNAIRQQFKNLLNDKDAMRGFSNEEKAAMEKVVRGSAVQNVARLISKTAPQHPLSGALTGGLAYGALGPAGLAIPVIGAAAKKYAEGATAKNAAFAEALTRAHAPAYGPVVDALLTSSPQRRLPAKTQLLLQTLMAQPNLIGAQAR